MYDTVNRRLNYVAKSELVMELLAQAYSDEDFSTVEENVIKRIARNLNFSNEKYKSIYTIFLKKYESQKYKANNKNEKSEKNHNKSDNSKKQSKSNESKNSSNSQSKNKNRISVSLFSFINSHKSIPTSMDFLGYGCIIIGNSQ